MIQRRPLPLVHRSDRYRAIEREKERLEHELDFAHRNLEEGYEWPAPPRPERIPTRED